MRLLFPKEFHSLVKVMDLFFTFSGEIIDDEGNFFFVFSDALVIPT